MTTVYGGYAGRVLQIDLSSSKVEEYPWDDKDRELFLGGKIMAAKILFDMISPGVDPLSPRNILVITTGPLTGTGAPSSSRFNISTLSPLTGFIASSNCGGNFGVFLKKAGYDGLIITGKAEHPIWIEIVEEKIKFHSAENLWGKSTGETRKFLGNNKGNLVIGPAGENLVRYASVFSEERTAGRAGAGAVMGSKNLKAIIVDGRKKTPVADKAKMKKLYKSWVKLLKTHPFTGERLPELGTAGLLRIMNARKILATRNFKYGQFKDFALVSGEYLKEKFLIKNSGCITCPIRCGRVVEVEGKKVKGPELETLGLLGPNLENNNIKLIIKLNFLLDELGMDTISTGSVLAFAMELQEKGLWANGLKFGITDGLEEVVKDIAYRRGIGNLLAEGTKRLAKKFGGREFAINSKGLELPAYEPRGAVGQGLGYAVANRGGCHLNAGYPVLLEGLGLKMDPYTPRGKAAYIILFQNIMEAVSSAGNCIFNLYALIPAFFIKKPKSKMTFFVNKVLPYTGFFINLLNKLPSKMLPLHLPGLPQTRALQYVTGIKINFGRLKEIGERGYNLERLINIRLGLTSDYDSLPARLTDEDSGQQGTKVPLAEMKKEYYKLRGWDERGVPLPGKIRKLKIGGGFIFDNCEVFKRD